MFIYAKILAINIKQIVRVVLKNSVEKIRIRVYWYLMNR